MRCKGVNESGTRCSHDDVPGLEYCIRHMPGELLEEAEDITGTIRCRNQFGAPDACHALAVEGTDPPSCRRHMKSTGNTVVRAARNAVEARLDEHLHEIMQGKGAILMDPPRISDPLVEMLDLASEAKALKEILRQKVAQLLTEDRSRYTSKVGEQIRAEIILYERAFERVSKIMMDISKMKIDDRLAGVNQQIAEMLERALNAALEESGVGLNGRLGAQKAFRRHLKVIEGELVE